jgi:hypothetical protein
MRQLPVQRLCFTRDVPGPFNSASASVLERDTPFVFKLHPAIRWLYLSELKKLDLLGETQGFFQ